MNAWREILSEPKSAFRAPGFGEASTIPRSSQHRFGEWKVFFSILLVGFLLRLFLALKLTSICDDGLYYVFVADCLDRGDLSALRQFLSLNIYPTILLTVHRLGFDWVTAGKIWGIFAGLLLMLPLYDWLKRMCDRPTAWIALFLYAVHPEFVELSVEPTRDTTFFLMLVTTLWAGWRAVNSAQWQWFFATGIAVTLAVHTRLEGWFLFPVLVFWSLRRAIKFPEWRWRLLAGNLWFIACLPLFVVLVNVTILRDQDHWELGRVSDFYTLRNLVWKAGSSVGLWAPRIPNDSDSGQPLGMPVLQRHEATEGSYIYLRQLAGGIKWVTLYLLLVGLTRWRRFLRDYDFGVLGGIAMTYATLIGVRLMFLTDINSRYFLTPLLCVLFVPAIGFRRIAAWFALRLPAERRQFQLAVTMLLVVGLSGLIDVARVKHPRRISELKFGRYLKTRFQPDVNVLVDVGTVRVGIGMLGRSPHVEWNPLEKRLTNDPLAKSADVMIFRHRGDAHLDWIRSRSEGTGLVEVVIPDSDMPPDGMEYLVLARPEALRKSLPVETASEESPDRN